MAQKANKQKASTQQHLDVEDITENLVLLKNGSAAMIMSTTAVNFDILSEAEQDATIYAYAAFLNSLSFPLQVIIRSKKADITSYYKHLEESMNEQPNPDLKKQIQKYMEFIKSTVQQKTILDKQFYFVINYSQIKVGFGGFGKQQPQKQKLSKTQLIKDAKINLFPQRDHVIKQAARLGLTAQQLSTKELIELFYDIYNPAPTGTQRIILDTAAYTAPLVQPAVESPAPAELPYGNHPTPSEPQPPNTSPQATQTSQEALAGLKNASSKAEEFIQQRQTQFSNIQPPQNAGPQPANSPVISQVQNQPVNQQPIKNENR